MFSKDITGSDAFREMPPSTQALYFHLGMEADDDGFLGNYKNLMRSVNSSEDDFKLLVAKRFLIIFPSKVVVLKHWLINNTVRKDRYNETKYLEEKQMLIVKENGSYTDDFIGTPTGNQLATQKRIEEDRTEEKNSETRIVPDSEEEPRTSKKKDTSYFVVFDLFSKRKQGWMKHTTQIESAKRLLEMKGIDEITLALAFYTEHKGEKYLPEIHTPFDLEAKWSKLFAFKERI